MFNRAERYNVPIKLAITGPSGAGKTYSALRLATGLAEGGPIAVLDTENSSASLYSDTFEFDVCNLSPPYDHDKFIKAINEAVDQDYRILIIDSASHFWEGILDYKSKLDQRGGNSFANWQTVNKYYKGILEAVLQSDIHLIACMRSKVDYVVEENEKGKAVPRKVGLAPIMRDGVEYEFTVVFDLDISHQAKASKDRTGLFEDQIFRITEDTGSQLQTWLQQGTDQKAELLQKLEGLGAYYYGEEVWPSKKQELIQWVNKGQILPLDNLTIKQLQRLISGIDNKMKKEAASS